MTEIPSLNTLEALFERDCSSILAASYLLRGEVRIDQVVEDWGVNNETWVNVFIKGLRRLEQMGLAMRNNGNPVTFRLTEDGKNSFVSILPNLQERVALLDKSGPDDEAIDKLIEF